MPAAFLAALAAGSTVAEAAEACGVSERTAYRWLTVEGVKKALNQLRAGMTSGALGILTSHLTEAAETLTNLLTSDSESVRLQASRAIFQTTLEIRQTVDMEDRIAELERRQRERA